MIPKYLEKEELALFLKTAQELPPKTITSEWKIELDPIVYTELEKHLAKQNEVRCGIVKLTMIKILYL